jgi:hypothetical protein
MVNGKPQPPTLLGDGWKAVWKLQGAGYKSLLEAADLDPNAPFSLIHAIGRAQGYIVNRDGTVLTTLLYSQEMGTFATGIPYTDQSSSGGSLTEEVAIKEGGGDDVTALPVYTMPPSSMAANFNMDYRPFSFSEDQDNSNALWTENSPPNMFMKSPPRWTLRNGVNDKPQDEYTDFSHEVNWKDSTANGNGSVVFKVGNGSPDDDGGDTSYDNPAKTWYVSSNGSDNNNGSNESAPMATVRAALQRAVSYKAARPNEWAAGNSATIIILGSLSESVTVDGTSYPPVILCGNNGSGTLTGRLTIGGGSGNPVVTLTNLTLNGGGHDVVTVSAGGNLVIQDGAVITGGGKGVVVNSGGAVIMSGGEVWGNTSHGVEVTGTFGMTGGVIGYNSAKGVNIMPGGAFTKKGGGIVYGTAAGGAGNNANNGGSIAGLTKTFWRVNDYPEPPLSGNANKTWYVSPMGSNNNNGWTSIAPVASVQVALEKAAAHKTDYPGEWNPGDSATIVVLDDMNVSNTTISGSISPVILRGNTGSIILRGSLTISGIAVTLEHITLNGGGHNVVTVSSGGNLVIQDGAVITGGGNGVVVNSGQVTMAGGEVQNNGGNGVQVNSGGTFGMTGGEIGGNTGGGVHISGGAVTKTGGGTVYGTAADGAGNNANGSGSIAGYVYTFGPADDYPPPPPPPPPSGNTARTWYVSSSGSNTNNGWTSIAPVASVQAALQKAADHKTDYPDEWNPGDSATIVVLDDMSVSNTTISGSISPVILRGSTDSISLTGSLTISGIAVTLEHITLNGSNGNAVTVSSGGELVIETGATITGGGSGVVVNSGQVTMAGGSVRGNSGNGVQVNSGGTFAMTGGEIGGNTGGGVYISGGAVTKTGGGTVYGTAAGGAGDNANGGGSIAGYVYTFGPANNYPVPPPPSGNTAKAWYVSPAGSDANDGWPGSAPVRTVSNALQKVAAYKTAHPTEWNPGDSATIVILGGLTESVTVDGTSYPSVILRGDTAQVTLTGALTISGGDGNSPAVTLTNVTLDSGNSDNAAVTVSGGNLVIQPGAVITGHGKGVVVNTGGAVSMTGGKVRGNSDDGVEVRTGGTFAMTGGEIGGNGGMGVNISGGTVTKTGGGIVYGAVGTAPVDNANFDGSIDGATKTYTTGDDYPPP